MKKRSSKNNPKLRRHDELILEGGVRLLAGVDEAGRGPLAGPVVAAAVIVKDWEFEERIDDSKKLSTLQRARAYREILTKCHLSVAVIERERIDAINIFRASLEAMQEAVRDLRPKPELVLVDGNTAPDFGCEARAVIGGDGVSFSIACASIAAKVLRDRLMELWNDRYPAYGFAVHKGYGTEKHFEALRKNGPCPIHRRSFAPVNAFAEEIAQMSPEVWEAFRNEN